FRCKKERRSRRPMPRQCPTHSRLTRCIDIHAAGGAANKGVDAMKAAYLDATGAPEVLRYSDLPDPVPRAGEIRIRVKAAALNPIDTYIRAGVVKMPLPLPFITGTDVAGTVDAVGPGVKRFKAGDRVWGSNQGLLGRQGTCAEFVCASEDFFYATPTGVSDDDAAAVALVGITAHVGLFQRAKLQTGET